MTSTKATEPMSDGPRTQALSPRTTALTRARLHLLSNICSKASLASASESPFPSLCVFLPPATRCQYPVSLSPTPCPWTSVFST